MDVPDLLGTPAAISSKFATEGTKISWILNCPFCCAMSDMLDLEIRLVRHGVSLANIGEVMPHVAGDAYIGLSELEIAQAFASGKRIGKDFLQGATVHTSPYERTRHTTRLIYEGAGLVMSLRSSKTLASEKSRGGTSTKLHSTNSARCMAGISIVMLGVRAR